MNHIFHEITEIGKEIPLVIDRDNDNRYRIVCLETDGSKSSYYFGTPIYNISTRKLIDFAFRESGNTAYYSGSNAQITVSNEIRIENYEGYCTLQLNNRVTKISKEKVNCGRDVIYPTANGVAYKIITDSVNEIILRLNVGTPYMDIRANDKCFSLMSERFRPFVTISCMGTLDKDSNIIAPAQLSYQKLSDREYEIGFKVCSPFGKYILFEINLYETKLMQDTTVESRNPKTNNAFGGTAFLGNTENFGNQWLYARFDYSKLVDLTDCIITEAKLYFPKFNRADMQLSAFKPASRFCSFGSNWENRIPVSHLFSHSISTGKYQVLDILPILTDRKSGHIIYSDGLILKSRTENSGFSVISTGDNFYAPQILEINYR